MTPLDAIEASSLGRALREWYPVLHGVHIAGVTLLFGSIALLDLRLLGLFRGVSATRFARRAVPLAAVGFLLIVPAGLGMFAAEASKLIANPVFALKLGLILLAGVNAAIFHAGAFRGVAGWDRDAPSPPAARAAAAASLAIWL